MRHGLGWFHGLSSTRTVVLWFTVAFVLGYWFLETHFYAVVTHLRNEAQIPSMRSGRNPLNPADEGGCAALAVGAITHTITDLYQSTT